jgi:hypothetical protein
MKKDNHSPQEQMGSSQDQVKDLGKSNLKGYPRSNKREKGNCIPESSHPSSHTPADTHNQIKEKRFKWMMNNDRRYSNGELIGLAKAMIKTRARVINIKEHITGDKDEGRHIVFLVKERFPIFKEQLASYSIKVEEVSI